MRLIDADALYKYVAESKKNNQHICERERLSHNIEHDHFMYMISMAPDIEAEPVRHGRWNIRTFDSPREGYYCSECGTVEWRTSRFCPECGAKMDGGDENEYGVD